MLVALVMLAILFWIMASLWGWVGVGVFAVMMIVGMFVAISIDFSRKDDLP